MANTVQLKRRIKTAQTVSKTTRAMQMIATSKLKRAQEAALSSRPYVKRLSAMSREITQKLQGKDLHPYMKESNSANKTLLLVFSPDKGLCGGLVTNLIKEYLHFFKDESIILVTLGKKIEHTAGKSQNSLLASFPFGNILPPFESVFPLIKIIDEYYLTKKVDRVKILYSKFENFFAQVPTVTTLLPIKPEKLESSKTESGENYQLFEPNPKEIVPNLLKHYVEMVLYQHLLENYVSEQAARMLAMQNATNNAKDIISQLTLEYNKARQERITNEILDISSASLMSS